MRILAAIVTFNRRLLLARCLDHLQKQTRPPDAIVVVNNSSSDGTEEMLRERRVKVITQENSGSAGGWRRCIQYAMDERFDAVWLMDDDGFPHAKALGALERAMSGNISCASSLVLREDQPTHLVFPMPMLDSAGQPAIFAVPRKLRTVAALRARTHGGTFPFAHLFNGALLRVESARQIGNVNPEYFIYGDEIDYFFRLRAAGDVVSVLDAAHFHPDVGKRPYSAFKVYYYTKNSLIVNARYCNFVLVRHLSIVVAVLARTALRNGPLTALSFLLGANAPIFYRAILRGLRGQIGKDFLA